MVQFAKRSYQKELLDRDDIPFEDIKKNMEELDVVNTWLGGHAITINGFRQLASRHRPLHVCEIGSGGGDNLAAIEKYCRKKNIPVQFTGIDINPSCNTVAQQRMAGIPARFITDDYINNKPDMPYDIIFSSLFCHHFTDEQLVAQLRWMESNSRLGFFINDLHRHPFAYYAIKGLTTIFSGSSLVKNDAPLSVARGFIKKDWLQLFDTAGISNFSVSWKWAFRWLIIRHK